MDYRETLNLPQTDFPMRGNLPQREPDILQKWENGDIYGQVQESRRGRRKFILHDGPPYANGDIHLGHALNKVLKDIIIRFKTMQGYDAPYVPGWDTHGLPIEQQVIKKLGLNRHAVSTLEFRARCSDYAKEYVEIQKAEFKRLGVRGNWDNAYLTLHKEYEAAQIGVFGEMAKKGYIYKGLKPVYWCPSCETALAEAEIDYADKKSTAIFVKFPVKEDQGLLGKDNTSVVIWTTTPWTLPANLAISVHPEYEYALVRDGEEYLVVAKELMEALNKTWNRELTAVKTVKGKELEGIVCRHPLMSRDSVLICGEHVTLEQGTGCVHTAPGHGEDDFIVGRQYGLDVLCPVDHQGKFTKEGGQYEGMKVEQANAVILKDLQEAGMLIHQDKIKHSYPHCWRCKNPIIFRATEQWFASIDGFRQAALEEIDRVEWIPAWGKDRIYNMIADRGDWCISRQRTWGVPIPIFYCEDCGKEIINEQTIEKLQEIFRQEGSDAWFAHSVEELLPEGLKCQCGGTEFRKETDIMDVWFDSGTSHVGVLKLRPELSYPADMYLEGSDQHRGWFNSSLSTSVAAYGQAPYKTVLTHGFLVDEKGRKMSKSQGNGVDPLQVVRDMGADILRLWVSSADYRNDVAASPRIMNQMVEAYRKIRNTLRFLLGNLYDFNPEQDRVEYSKLQEIDRWVLTRLARVIEKVIKAYETYEFHVVYHTVHNFCTVELSAIYLDIVKDRAYVEGKESLLRRSAQTVMNEILNALVRLLAPILVFTADEIWAYIPGADPESNVQIEEMPKIKPEWVNEALAAKWEKILAIRNDITKALETARQEKLINHSLTAKVDVYVDPEQYAFVSAIPNLEEIVIVSRFIVHELKDNVPEGASASEFFPGLKILVSNAPGKKCERCWIYYEDSGTDTEYPDLCPRCAAVVRSIGK
ncbi:Isoleucyl-tRNA synthetase [Syntrophobotulus glycolicus DSM 8271]|uniref:Isoleucine--tRNA ligase n=1 Tax=Syntrophobotulus glycolicus (strain DSM 8271 / FlGlyR) TaxID=645991 RepID=F0T014_SYNGF|nr:isoleucine--tRNA ligase [Syntrophobotulus glycolicus]ADY55025.1 Isoleucyl-tRNA synthetase [Syntrophobotulus glycolicus DSM 8271]